MTRAADDPNVSIAEDLLSEKLRLEIVMRALPHNRPLRVQYFSILEELSRLNFGAYFANFPEIDTPLMFRGSTSDTWNLEQVFGFYHDPGDHIEKFAYGEYEFPIPAPRRILDLGAYCGYTAVYFANRFPNAQIIAVEPPGPNFNALLVNTAAYQKICRLPAAVWHERTQVSRAGCIAGDWGTYFTAAREASPADAIPAYTISDILEMYGWDGVDFIKCTVQGGMAELLAGPVRPWLEQATCVTTKPVAGRWREGEEAALLAAFPDGEFETSRLGELLIFRRRSALDNPGPRPRTALPLIPPSPQRRPFTLANISHEQNFYSIGHAGIQLTPNPPGSPRATFVMRLPLDNHGRFSARIVTGPGQSAGVIFAVRICNAASGAAVIEAEQALPVDQAFEWNIDFDPASGLHEVILSTERVRPDPIDPDPPSATFIDAKFV